MVLVCYHSYVYVIVIVPVRALMHLIYLQKFACTHACMHAHTHKHISENKCLQTTTERANGNMAGLSGPRTAARPRSEASAPACQGLRVSGLEAGDHLCI